MGTLLSVVTQLVMMEESVHGTVSMFISVGVPLSAITLLVHGIFASRSSNVNISGNTTFSNNSNSNVDIIGNTIFSCNTASDNGAVHAEESIAMWTSLHGNTIFSCNSAGDHGAWRSPCRKE